MEYICLECGGLFQQPAQKKGEDKRWEGSRWEQRYCSPCCGHGFEAVCRCDLCGAVVKKDGIGKLCALCAADAAGRLRQFVRKTYTRQEQEALDILTEGISFTCLGGEEKEETECQTKSGGGN